MGKYVNIQMKREVHDELKKYAKNNGHSISGLVERLVKNEISKPKPESNKILRSY